MITINAHKGKFIELKITGAGFHADLAFIKKELVGRRYNAETKMWEIPILKANFKILEKAKKHLSKFVPQSVHTACRNGFLDTFGFLGSVVHRGPVV